MVFIRQVCSPLLAVARYQVSQRTAWKLRAGLPPALFRPYSDVKKVQGTQDPAEPAIKTEASSLHRDGHCSLEDKPQEAKSSEETKSTILEDIKNLPSEEESKRSALSKWMVENLDKLQTTIFTAGQTLNDFTGYSSIEKLKRSIEDQGK